jgi:hypothetical protein
MKEFEVTITETLSKRIKIQAEDLRDARNKVSEMYFNEKIVLSADDFSDYSIDVEDI